MCYEHISKSEVTPIGVLDYKQISTIWEDEKQKIVIPFVRSVYDNAPTFNDEFLQLDDLLSKKQNVARVQELGKNTTNKVSQELLRSNSLSLQAHSDDGKITGDGLKGPLDSGGGKYKKTKAVKKSSKK